MLDASNNWVTRLYTLCLQEDHGPTGPRSAILVASLTQAGHDQSIKFDEDVGDHTFDLSAVLGNENGILKWGSSGFHQSARHLIIKSRGGQQQLVVDLQNSSGQFASQSIDLEDHFHLVEYLNPCKNKTYHRLRMKICAPPARSLVLCFDGTSNHFGRKNTNVVKFMELLKKNDPERQLVYYQTGVGTYAPPGLLTNVGLTLATTLDMGFASFLYQHVIDGYKFLMQTYRTGDRISIFGFSRGAFTARVLAGMIHCVGLLPKDNIEHVPFAYEVYRKANDEKPRAPKESPQFGGSTTRSSTSGNSTLCSQTEEPAGALLCSKKCSKATDVNPEDFKQTFCISVAIDFVGVWDTVASVGSLWPKTLPWIEYNPSIRNFRQALALDERRANFVPNVWDHSRTNPDTQTALEVWFKGGHTDIGGGAVPKGNYSKGRQSMLSNISLRWMVRQCFDAHSGIIFDHRALERYQAAGVLEGRPPKENSESATEYERKLLEQSAKLDKDDITYEPYDAMREHWSWNLLEFLPSAKPAQTMSGLSMTRRPNLYKPRTACRPQPPHPVAIHASVVDYLAFPEGEQYTPRAFWLGYNDKELPLISDPLNGNHAWPDKATTAINMDWKQRGCGKWAKSWISSWRAKFGESKGSGGPKECF